MEWDIAKQKYPSMKKGTRMTENWIWLSPHFMAHVGHPITITVKKE